MEGTALSIIISEVLVAKLQSLKMVKGLAIVYCLASLHLPEMLERIFHELVGFISRIENQYKITPVFMLQPPVIPVYVSSVNTLL